MTSKTRKNVQDVEQQFNAKSFGSFGDINTNAKNTDEMLKLLRRGTNSKNSNMNSKWGGGRYRSSQPGRSFDREKLLVFQRIDASYFGIVFQGFFDVDLKEIIKPIAAGGYQSESKAWLVPVDSKGKLMSSIFQYCLDHDIKIVDVPEFVDDLLKRPVPFSANSKLAKSYDYSAELTTNKKSISVLPEKLASCLYNF